MTGRLYGIGIGPGDPELLTMKAFRVLRSSAVVAYPLSDSGLKLARSIVAEYLRPEQIEVPMYFPFKLEAISPALLRQSSGNLSRTPSRRA